DGSGYKGGIGAAAVLIRDGQEPRKLRYHLGPNDEHTVYEAETLGLTLAARLLATERNVTYPVSILLDNQAAIKCGTRTNKDSSDYIPGKFKNMVKHLSKRRNEQGDFDLTIRWIPGHENVAGNEFADQEAKLAAEGPHRNSSNRHLPKYLQ
ncbi:ribonuclease H-like domain-containing protein, partial [Suillus clintonianus]|uniref:ribonuclease H-like domain-containing protein n=1 Tax=Suillus clintonianus TaxID=1904413 RepID=UPI001B8701E0